MKTQGFTLIELIMVIVLIGTLAVYAAPKFTGNAAYNVRSASGELKEAIRYAQHQSMINSGLNHFQIIVSANGFVVTQAGVAINHPVSSVSGYSETWSSVTSASTPTISFNSRGNVCNSAAPCITFISADIAITLSESGQSETLTIEPITGYVH